MRFASLLLAVPFLAVALLLGSPPLQQPEPAELSGAFEAMQWGAGQRAYPGETLPPGGFERGLQQLTDLHREHGRRQVDNEDTFAPWRSMGPHNVAGRILSVALNPERPETIWAASASGGLWRSYSAGEGVAAWHRVPTGFPVLAASAVALAPDDTSVVYLGTGEVYNRVETHKGVAVRETRGAHGIGILKSEDGGATWAHVLDWGYEANRGVQMLRVNPLRPATVWAATTEGLLASYDAGASWTTVLDRPLVTDLYVHPADTLKMVAAVGNLGQADAGLYASRDGGATWTHRPDAVPASWNGRYGGKALFSTHAANPDVVYASIGNGSYGGAGTTLARSLNGGWTWEVRNTQDYSTYQGWYSHFVVAHPVYRDQIITAGVDVFTSTNGGVALTQRSGWHLWEGGRREIGGPEGPDNYSHADHHAYAIHPDDPDLVYLANDGGIFRTTDFGMTFRALNGGLQTTQFYNGTANSRTDSTFATGGLQDNSFVYFRGDKAWQLQQGGDGTWTAINPNDDDNFYISSQRLAMYVTRDGGQSYESAANSAMRQGAAFVAPFVLAPSSPSVMYAGSKTVYRSDTGARAWESTTGNMVLDGNPIAWNPVLALAVAPSAHNTVYATTAPVERRAGVFRTFDGGENWTNVTGNLPDRYPMDVAVHPTNDRIAYVAFSGFGVPHVWRTADGGATWTDASGGLPDLPTNAVAIDPNRPTRIFAGTDYGVFVSEDEGATWVPFTTGLPEAVLAMDLTISPANNALRLATYGNGMFERPLPEKTVIVANEPTAPVSIRLTVAPNPATTRVSFALEKLAAERGVLNVYDIAGRVVARRDVGAGAEQRLDLDVSSWAAGPYVYQLSTGEAVSTGRFVVVK